MSSTSPRKAYPLGRNTLAAARLDLQHYLWTECLGYHLHPSIPIPPNAQIADIGCGTAIWSLTLPTSVTKDKNIHIDAMDLSLSQAPPTEWLPSHLTRREFDIFSDPLPSDLVGKYDIIHVRLFLFVVQQNDPLPILRNLLKMLKPGGYLHWQEYDTTTTELVTITSEPEVKITALKALFNALSSAASPSWPAKFHTVVGENAAELGATLVKHDVVEHTPKCLLPLRQEANFMGTREFIASMQDADKAAAFEKLVSEAEEESWTLLRRGGAFDSAMVTWVLRKSA